LSNLAVKIRQKQYQEQQSKHRAKEKVIVKKRPLFTLGEKILFMIFLFIVLIGSIFIVSNYVKLYQVNMDIQAIEMKVKEQERMNHDLLIQKKELSNPERIWSKAKELGLTLNPNHVKGVQD
jgi:cell division protein FtsL